MSHNVEKMMFTGKRPWWYGNASQQDAVGVDLGANAVTSEVAMKEVRELFGFFSDEQRYEIVRRFSDVVRAAATLAHPNILPIHDVNLWSEFPYVVTELAPNGSCRRLIISATSRAGRKCVQITRSGS